MNLVDLDFIGKPRLRALRDHFAMIEDPREPCGWRPGCPCCCLSPAGRSAIATATRPSRSMARLRYGKTWRRWLARAKGQAPLHLVSAFAVTRRRVLRQAAGEGKTKQRTAL